MLNSTYRILYLSVFFVLACFYQAKAQATVVISDVQNACTGQTNGSFTITVTAGTPPFSLFVFGVENSTPGPGGPITLNVPFVVNGLRDDNYLISINDGDIPNPNYSGFQRISLSPVATVNAGPDQASCDNGAITLAGTIGGSATSATWSGGAGTFTPNNTTLNATYVPTAAEITAGTVTLTLTTDDPPTTCPAVADNMTITINPLATVSAGGDQTICEGTGAVLGGTVGGAATSGSWSGGGGTFSPNNTDLNATYTPSAAEIAAGTVTLTLTTNDPAGPCVPVTDDVVLTIDVSAKVDAGPDQTSCDNGTVTLAGSISGAATSATWSGGAGTFAPDNTTLNATYTPTAAEITAGTVTLILTTNDPAGICPAATDNITITINPLPTVSAGGDQTICEGTAATLNGTVGGAATSGTWSGGTGTFSPGNTDLNASYTPSAAEITAGTVTLTLTTNDPAGPCVPVTDDVVITIDVSAKVNAGPDQTSCDNGAVTLAGSISGAATSATWSGGTGTFSPNNTTLTATYTPSAAEITAGTVTLTLTTNDPAGICPAATDNITITINPLPTVSAGSDQTICEGTSATLNGTVGGAATSGTWSGGTGTFSPSNTALNATYTPSAAEITAGTVTLTLTTDDPTGPCVPVTDDVVITIDQSAKVNAGPDQSSCDNSAVTLAGSISGAATSATWSGGTGTFSPNNTTLTATYTPSAAEITAGTVTLTLTTNDPAGICPAATDNITITINPLPTVSAGSDQTICEGTSATLNGTVGGAATSGTWSGGTGTFAPGNTTLNASYTPSAAEITAGTVTLTLTTDDPAGSCVAVSDNVTITIDKAAIVDAGTYTPVCAGSTITLAGTIGGSAVSATWSGGTGTFAPNNTTLNAVYTPSAAEITAGSVTLTLTTNDPAGPCGPATDNATITIAPPPTVGAGPDQTICEGTSATLAGTIGGAASSATWSGGTGTFAPGNTTLNASYTPSAAEITAGTVTLTLTTDDPAGSCVAVSDNVTITIDQAATVDAGTYPTVCAGSTITLAGVIGGSATSATWTGGSGTFAPNNTDLNATYTPSAAEITAGVVNLTLTTNDPAGICNAATDNATITLAPAPTVDAGTYTPICSDATISLAGTIGGAATTATWTGGTGTFGPNNTTLNATYTPSAAEITAGTVTLTLTTDDPAGTCVAATDNATITIEQAATVDAGTYPVVCAGSTINLAGVIGGSATSATWTGGSGTFAPNNTDLNAVYTPSAAEITAGVVNLTLTTNDPTGVCAAAADNATITLAPAPTVDAGTYAPICSDATISLAGTIGGAATTATWTGGTGTFAPNNTTLNAIYTPSAAEITAGTVTLTLTTDDPAGTCVAATDNVTITIEQAATVDAGTYTVICSGSTINLTGTIGGSATTATWTGGSGTFTPNNTDLNAVYTPSAAEVTAGVVNLTLTTNDPTGVCAAATDNASITIAPAPAVDAGTYTPICSDGTISLAGTIGGAATTATWTGGTGTFAPNNTTLNATYTPSAAEITAGTVTLTLTTDDPAGACVAATDNATITIEQAATADAGTYLPICSGSTISLTGVIGGSAISATWTGGTGTFSPNNTDLNAVYTPSAAEVTAGTVTLTLTTNDPTGVCVAAVDNATITIAPAPTADAGTYADICEGQTISLAGIIGGAATTATWTGGTGTFSPGNTDLNATYTPSAAEITAGSVTLTLTTDDPAGTCVAATDNTTITINPAPTPSLGGTSTACEGSTGNVYVTDPGKTNYVWTVVGGTITLGGTATDNTVTITWPSSVGPNSVSVNYTDAGCAAPIPTTQTVTVSAIAGITLAATDVLACEGDASATLAYSNPAGVPDEYSLTFDAPAIVAGFANIAFTTLPASPITITLPGGVLAGAYNAVLVVRNAAANCPSPGTNIRIIIDNIPTISPGTIAQICSADASFDIPYTSTGTADVYSITFGAAAIAEGFTNVVDAALTATPIVVTMPTGVSGGPYTATISIRKAGSVCPSPDAAINFTVTDSPILTIDVNPSVCQGTTSATLPYSGVSNGPDTYSIDYSAAAEGAGFIDEPNTALPASPIGITVPGGTPPVGVYNATLRILNSVTGCTNNIPFTVTIRAIPTATISGDQTVCVGQSPSLTVTLTGGGPWDIAYSTDGGVTSTTITNITSSPHTFQPAVIPVITTTYTLVSVSNTCGAGTVSGSATATITPIPGDQVTFGADTWIGYVYNDASAPSPPVSNINFAGTKYRGFIGETEMSGFAGSTYTSSTDVFDMNLSNNIPVQGPNVCGSYLDQYSVRFKMRKTFTAGVYTFTVGGDDGVRLTVDGVSVLPAGAFNTHSYTTYTSNSICLSAGTHDLVLEYFEQAGFSRVSFTYQINPVPDVTPPAPSVCVNSAAPTLTASGGGANVTGYRWYKEAALTTVLGNTANFTPAAADLDMTTAGTTTFYVVAVYACGQGLPASVAVNVVNSASVAVTDSDVCQSGGVVDLTTFVTPTPTGGTFTFTGHPAITGNNFDPAGLTGVIPITVNYALGTCSAPQRTLNLTIITNTVITVTNPTITLCQGASPLDLNTNVSASAPGGDFVFTGSTAITGDNFDPAAVAPGSYTINVNYTVGGACSATQRQFTINVVGTPTVTVTSAAVCPDKGPVSLLSYVTPNPGSGTFTFTGPNVTGNSFDPSTHAGTTVSINYSYTLTGCTAVTGTISIPVRLASDPACTSGPNCFAFTITVLPEPQTVRPSCADQDDGIIMMTVSGVTPGNYIVQLISTTDTFTQIGPAGTFTFTNLSPAKYDYKVTDAAGNICQQPYNLPLKTVVTATASNFVNAICFGDPSGKATLTVTGGNSPYEYSIDGGTNWISGLVSGNVISNLPPNGVYNILVRDDAADACPAEVQVTINNSNPQVTFNFTNEKDVTTCAGTDGEFTVSAIAGGKTPYRSRLLVADPSSITGFSIVRDFENVTGNSITYTDLVQGSYVIVIEDGNGCFKDSRNTPVNIDAPGVVDFTPQAIDASCLNNGQSGTIRVVFGTAPFGNYEVAIEKSQNVDPVYTAFAYDAIGKTFDKANVAGGNYFVFVRPTTAGAKCPTIRPVAVGGPIGITFDIEPLNCDNNELSITLTNVTGDRSPGAQNRIVRIYRKGTNDLVGGPSLPVTGDFLNMDYDDPLYAFLKIAGLEVDIQVQQQQAGCTDPILSPRQLYVVNTPLSAEIGKTTASFRDESTGTMAIINIRGGNRLLVDDKLAYQTTLELKVPKGELQFFESGPDNIFADADGRFEKKYSKIPSGDYEVTITDNNGCSLVLNSTSLPPAIVPVDETVIPINIFTPNGDGFNDTFYIRNLPEGGNHKLTVANRWGQQVYSSSKYSREVFWTAEGVSDGIYFYTLKIDGGPTLKGWVEITRGNRP